MTMQNHLEAIYELETKLVAIELELGGLKHEVISQLRALGRDAICAGDYAAIMSADDLFVRKFNDVNDANFDAGITA